MKLSQEVDQDFSEGRMEKSLKQTRRLTADRDTVAQFIVAAAQETFATMLGVPITLGETPDGKDAAAVNSERVLALIGLAGRCSGMGVISCSPALACQLSSKLLADHFQTVTSEVLDAMGELSNMIFGNVKNMLEKQTGQLGLSIPTVIFGRNFSTRSMGEQWIVVSLRVEQSDLDLRMCLSQS